MPVAVGHCAASADRISLSLSDSLLNPFLLPFLPDCMHVASEPGDYIYKKSPPPTPPSSPLAALKFKRNAGLLDLDLESLGIEELEAAAAAAAAAAAGAAEVTAETVCGLYVIGEPDTIVEITMKHYDVNCESGGLMAVSRRLQSAYRSLFLYARVLIVLSLCPFLLLNPQPSLVFPSALSLSMAGSSMANTSRH